MPLTVGEWEDILRQRKTFSHVWGVQTSYTEHVLQAIKNIFSEDKSLFFVSCCSPYVLEPYPPLFELLRNLKQETKFDTATLLSESHVYSLHQSLFESLYENKVIHRDILFLEELSFEQYRLEESLLTQIVLLTTTYPTIWVITDAQYLPEKTISLFRQLLARSFHHLQLFLLASSIPQNTFFTDFWEELIQDGLAYELDPSSSFPPLPPLSLSVQELFSRIRLLLHYFHFKEAISLLETIRPDIYITEDEIMYFYFKGMAHYYLREFQQAIESFH
ncbi:MAG: hypothetical protein ACK4TN_06555, partial [Brevinematales bacterium]